MKNEDTAKRKPQTDHKISVRLSQRKLNSLRIYVARIMINKTIIKPKKIHKKMLRSRPRKVSRLLILLKNIILKNLLDHEAFWFFPRNENQAN